MVHSRAANRNGAAIRRCIIMDRAAVKPLTKPLAGVELVNQYREIRGFTEWLCAPLAVEDYVAQSMPDVSPTKWHIAHVTWFFETFVLKNRSGYASPHPQYEYLFNSYYNAVGQQYPRPQRSLLTRPTVQQIVDWRRSVDAAMVALIESEPDPDTLRLIELGLRHEQQHQELLLMDIKHVFSHNPLLPAYRRPALSRSDQAADLRWESLSGGLKPFGHQGEGFAFDNETPTHTACLDDYQLANRLVTNGEYLAFIEDGGYQQAALWLADGWHEVIQQAWRAPLYWVERDSEWFEFTLYGLQPIDLQRPVCHVSFYEADAFASWSGARLPTEYEWEHVATNQALRGHLLDRHSGVHPAAAVGDGWQQLLGDCWEWTRSAYQPYPGFKPPAGAVGEYNGKFMINQLVLRGGACVTPTDHIRTTYRNFYYPHQRWMFSGIRLAK